MVDDPQIAEYLNRAEELLRLAQNTSDPKTKEFLIQCARDYKEWAEGIRFNLPQH
jgi:hypothetical protein